MATWPAKTNYATGDVLTAAQMNDIGGELNDLYTTAGKAAGKNKIINGDFGIWQRGTSSSAQGYQTADRFTAVWDGTGTKTISRQTFTTGTAPVAGYEAQYFLRFDQTVAGTGASYNAFLQPIEDVRTFAGQTITLSFWAKASATTVLPKIELGQNFGSGGSASVDTTIQSNLSITTSWTRYAITYTVPSVSGKTIGTSSSLRVAFYMPINATFTVDLWGVQLEAGSTATQFQTATGTIQGELAACQRYYTLWASGSAQPIGMGTYLNGTQVNGTVALPVEMRTAPTISQVTGTNYYRASSAGGGSDDFNSLTLDTCSTRAVRYYNASEAAGTAGQAAVITTNNAASFLAFQAEL